jgi:hypothetical protein
MDILEHSQLSITADLYTHVLPVLIEDAAKRMNDALAGEDGDVDVTEDVNQPPEDPEDRGEN